MRSILNNKKAQEFSITTLVVLVLAIIVLVVVILGFWKGWDYIFSKIGVLPSGLEAAVQSCQLSAQGDLETSYCYELKSVTINNVKQYVNCETLSKSVTITPVLSRNCVDKSVKLAEVNLCKTLKKNETIVNTKDCKAIFDADALASKSVDTVASPASTTPATTPGSS